MSNNRIPKEGKIFLLQNLILVKLGLFYSKFFSILLLLMPGIEGIIIFYFFEVYLTRRHKLNMFRDMS